MSRPIEALPVTLDPSPVSMPTGLEFRRNDTNRRLLRSAWKAVGLNPRYPLSTDEALSMLKLMGYEVNRRRFSHHMKYGYVQPPPKQGKDFRWDEQHIVAFADSLESTRNWIPMHPCHVHKLTDEERIAHQVEAAKRHAAIVAFAQMHPIELIGQMTKCDNAELRELMACALKMQSGLTHVRGMEQPTDHIPAESN